jgi:hypothetical protein
MFGKRRQTREEDRTKQEVREAQEETRPGLFLEPLERRLAPGGVGFGRQVGWGC